MHKLKLFFVAFAATLSLHSVGFCEEETDLNKPLIEEPAAAEKVEKEVKIQPVDTSKYYPTAVLLRPWTIPVNAFETALKFKAGSHGAGDNAFYSLNTLSFGYGVTNDFEVGLSWDGMKVDTISFNNFKAEPSVSLNLGYFLYAIPHLSSMATFSLPFHFDREVVKTSSFAIPTSISVIRGKLAFLTFYYDTVVVHWRDNGLSGNDHKAQYTVDFNFPIKLNYQATNSFITSVETLLGSIGTDGKYTHIGQRTPLYLNALYAITNSFDVLAKTGFSDVQDWRNSFSFIAGVAYRFGALNG